MMRPNLTVLTITNIVTLIVGLAATKSESAEAKSRTIKSSEFCSSLQSTLKAYASQNHQNSTDSRVFANLASQKIMKQLKAAELEEYYDVTSISNSEFSAVKPENRSWLNVPDILAQSMGVEPRHVIVVNSVDELKMVAHVAPQSQLLVLAASMGQLNLERAQAVIEAGQFSKIQINVIWLGQAGLPKASMEILKSFAIATSGAFMDLSSTRACPRI